MATAASYVGVDGGQLYYEMAGEGDTVVLIHGGAMDRRIWDEQFARYATSYQVIRYDVRGFGESSRSASEPYSDDEDLLALLNALNIARAHVIGLSLGARIAINFALAQPDRVSTLVLAGPGVDGYAWSEAMVARFSAYPDAIRESGGKGAVELWLADPHMIPAMENPALAPRLREICMENATSWEGGLPARQSDPPAIQRLGELRAPTLILVGDRDVPDILDISRLLSEQIAGAQKVVIPGAGHILNMEAPEIFDRQVLAFLGSQRQPT